jgi:hypothetical protein
MKVKSTTNFSHLITENYRPVTSQQQIYHTSSQKPEYTGENHRPVTSQQQTFLNKVVICPIKKLIEYEYE